MNAKAEEEKDHMSEANKGFVVKPPINGSPKVILSPLQGKSKIAGWQNGKIVLPFCILQACHLSPEQEYRRKALINLIRIVVRFHLSLALPP